MSDTNSCVPGCALACNEACAAATPAGENPIRLEEARARFRSEARNGTCDTGRYRLNYFSWGTGPPLLFIHGVSDSRLCFLLPIARLSAHFRCIAYDLPCGRGDDARLDRYTHADLVSDVWALLDHLGLARSYVFASSFGSTIALAALRARPERLLRAILQGGLAYRPLSRAERLLARLGRFLPGSMGRLPLRKLVLRAINQEAFARRHPEVWDFYLESSGRAPIAAFAHQALLLHHVDLRPVLPEVRQPVLLVCGDGDRSPPGARGPASTDVLLQGLPNAGRVVIEGCGHVPSYSHPEALAEVVRRFLTPPGCQGG
jgi:pimeloyl-ACP methyl ester carboxylesterase